MDERYLLFVQTQGSVANHKSLETVQKGVLNHVNGDLTGDILFQKQFGVCTFLRHCDLDLAVIVILVVKITRSLYPTEGLLLCLCFSALTSYLP